MLFFGDNVLFGWVGIMIVVGVVVGIVGWEVVVGVGGCNIIKWVGVLLVLINYSIYSFFVCMNIYLVDI